MEFVDVKRTPKKEGQAKYIIIDPQTGYIPESIQAELDEAFFDKESTRGDDVEKGHNKAGRTAELEAKAKKYPMESCWVNISV